MKRTLFKSLIFGIGTLVMFACSNNDNPTTPNVPGVSWIPSDNTAGTNPEIENANTTIPNFQYSVESENGTAIIRIDLTGIQDPNNINDWLRLYGTNTSLQNVWISVDGMPKGFTVANTIDESDHQVSAVDLVFLVDNSGSMSEEANAIARDILAWSDKLSKTLDMRFGCIGYDEGWISGGLDITNVNTLSTWLNRYSGTSRTHGFSSDAGKDLESVASQYRVGNYHECGVAALRMADENFTFRQGSNRLYVNFTDEPTQPNNQNKFSTEWVRDPDNWPAVKGTIHTVYSADTTYREQMLQYEKPWRLSHYTGGTVIVTNSYFTNVTLDDLPVTGALQNSYIFRFTNCENLFDGLSHVVKITILSPDGTVRAEREINVTFNR